MINFAVINLKNLIKNGMKIILIFAFSFGMIRIRWNRFFWIKKNKLYKCIKKSIKFSRKKGK